MGVLVLVVVLEQSLQDHSEIELWLPGEVDRSSSVQEGTPVDGHVHGPVKVQEHDRWFSSKVPQVVQFIGGG